MNAKKNIYVTIIIISLFSNVLLFSQVRLGLDLGGKVKVGIPAIPELGMGSATETYDVDSGISIGYDKVLKTEEKMQLGVGGEFMIKRGIEELSEGKASFSSIYGFGKYMIDEKIYGYGRLGYNFHSGDNKYTDFGDDIDVNLGGGLMFAFGGGFDLTPTIRAEIQFVSHSAELELRGDADLTIDLKYKRTSLGLIMTL